MKSVDLFQEDDGTWTARIFAQSVNFRSYEEAVYWLRSQGEEI